MNFSFSAAWDQTVVMLRSHGSLLLAVAGVFFLLPALMMGQFLPAPEETGASMFAAFEDYYRSNAGWFLLGSLVNAIGSISIYLLLLGPTGRHTVGGAIAAAMLLLPFYFLTSVIVSAAIFAGLILLVVPGLYLMGRLAVSGTLLVAEGLRSPIAAVRGSWALTKGRGWAVAGLILIVGLAGLLVSFGITFVLGSVFILIGGRELGGLLVLILNSALTAIYYTVMVSLFAAIYRQLSRISSPGAAD